AASAPLGRSLVAARRPSAARARLQSGAPFGIASRTPDPPSRAGLPYGCGCSSGVEHDLAKVGVEGSNPFARSKNFFSRKGIWPKRESALGNNRQSETRVPTPNTGKIRGLCSLAVLTKKRRPRRAGPSGVDVRGVYAATAPGGC